MSEDAGDVGIAVALEMLNGIQDQLKAITESNARIETAQLDMLERLDRIEADQAKLELVAQVAAFAHAAAMGNRAPLPVETADDPLLERFALTQPADHVSTDRALVEWRQTAGAAGTAELVELLARQYRPSPTDTAETRVLRYRLAAITRFHIQGRGATPPVPPETTVAEDRSDLARRARSADLARLWRAGGSTALYAEPELAGALDLFEQAERQGAMMSEEELAARLRDLHRELADNIEGGQRPSLTGMPVKAPVVPERGGYPDMER
jgi:hypothetical protein